MNGPIPETSLLFEAERIRENGWVVVTCANFGYLSTLLNWLISIRRAGVHNTIIVTLDAPAESFLRERGFATVFVPTVNTLPAIRTHRLLVTQSLVRNGVSVVQSDADAVWLRDARPSLTGCATDLVATQGTYWPNRAYDAWGFVLCTGLYALQANQRTTRLLERWARDLDTTGSDQQSLNRLLVSDGVNWQGAAEPSVVRFRDRDFKTFHRDIPGYCAGTDLSLRLLPHRLFQRVPVKEAAPLVLHHLPDLAKLPETRELTGHGSWLLAEDWQRTDFDATTLERAAAHPRPMPWQSPRVRAGRQRN